VVGVVMPLSFCRASFVRFPPSRHESRSRPMVKKLFAQGGRAVSADIPAPELRAGEVLVAPAFSVVSAGTETATIAMSADPARIHDHDYPAPDGHRFGPQIRSASVAWGGPTPRTAPEQYALIGYSLAGRVVAVSP